LRDHVEPGLHSALGFIPLFGPASSFTAHPYLHSKLPYDPRDLAPVARVSSTLVSIGVPPSLGTRSLKEIFARARAEPGKLNWASTTGATELIINAFFKTSGLNMARIPIATGAGARRVARAGPPLLGGPMPSCGGARRTDQYRRGTATGPTAILPGVPTVAQAGFPELTFDGLSACSAPATRRWRCASASPPT
jgi:hypothetical protein